MSQVENGCKIAMEALRILEQSRISPAPALPSPASLPLSFFDVILYPAGAVHRLFFYQFSHPTAVMVDSVVPQLKSSLGHALRQFYPLAGNLRRSEITCTDADSVFFVIAECEADFRELSSGRARSLAALRCLVPRLSWSGEARMLMAVQVTAFPGQGFVIGTTVHHVACDDASLMHFVKSWAVASQTGRLVEPSPVIDRSTITNPFGVNSLNIFPDFDSANPDESLSNAQSDFYCATFPLKGGQLQRLKSLVMAKSTHHCSTVVVAYAYVWVCMAKTLGYAGDDIKHFIFTAECRARLTPAAPAAYFGNCIVPCFVEVKAGDLVGEEGVIVASKAIGKVIEEMREGDYLASAQEWGQRCQVAAATQHMSVAGSPKFTVYDKDFGWGRPVKVDFLILRRGAILISDSRDGDGVEIGVGLSKAEMELFERHFSDGMKLTDVGPVCQRCPPSLIADKAENTQVLA